MSLLERSRWRILWLGLIGMAVKGLLIVFAFFAFLGMLNHPRETFGFLALAAAVQLLEKHPIVSIGCLLIGGAITLANRPDDEGTTDTDE